MTGQQRTRRDVIRDWMVLMFALAVICGVLAAAFASPRVGNVAGVFTVAALVLAFAYTLADKP